MLSSLNAKKRTGCPTEKDINRAAVDIYNGEARISEMYSFLRDDTKEPGAEFPFLNSLRYLRTTNFWDMILRAKDNHRKQCSNTMEEATDSMAETPQFPTLLSRNSERESASYDPDPLPHPWTVVLLTLLFGGFSFYILHCERFAFCNGKIGGLSISAHVLLVNNGKILVYEANSLLGAEHGQDESNQELRAINSVLSE